MKKDGKSIDEVKGGKLNPEKVQGGQNVVSLDEMGGQLTVDNPNDIQAKKKGYEREKGAN